MIPFSLDESLVLPEEKSELLIELEDALQRLELLDERLVRVVECRFFGGLTIEETAAAMSLSSATIKRDWLTARAWLYRDLNQNDGGNATSGSIAPDN